MENFKIQIADDIKEIQEQFISIDPKLQDDAYAFNFWVLQKLYSVEEENIPSYILEDSDRGIDCYYFNEDRKVLYLIQNKYYGDNTPIDYKTIVDEFKTRSLEHLHQGIYKRSKELQDFFTKFKDNEDFVINLHYYVTNNRDNHASIKEKFENYSYKNIKGIVRAKFFSLEDIEQNFLSNRIKPKNDLFVELHTLELYTRVDLDPSNKKLDIQNLIRSQFMPVNVFDFYKLIEQSKKDKYLLFEENVRDFIGEDSQINKAIIETLSSDCPIERSNFLFYNNGITIIADEINIPMKELNKHGEARSIHSNTTIVKNPQIVNGCQTVNSIYHVLKNKYHYDRDRKDAYKNVFVMVKLLQLSTVNDRDTYLNIVKYNNSQNAIKIKDFVANEEHFTNLHNDLKNQGFFLITKQSHAYAFKNIDKTIKNNMLFKANNLCKNLEIEIKESDLKIDLTKLLQTILAYYDSGYAAYVRKPEILKKGSKTYDFVTEKIKSLSRKEILSIYLYFLKAEKERKKTKDKINPVPYYLLTILSRIQYDGLVSFENSQQFIEDYIRAEKASINYTDLVEEIEPQYNKRIKKPMHEDKIALAIKMAR